MNDESKSNSRRRTIEEAAVTFEVVHTELTIMAQLLELQGRKDMAKALIQITERCREQTIKLIDLAHDPT